MRTKYLSLFVAFGLFALGAMPATAALDFESAAYGILSRVFNHKGECVKAVKDKDLGKIETCIRSYSSVIPATEKKSIKSACYYGCNRAVCKISKTTTNACKTICQGFGFGDDVKNCIKYGKN